MDRRERARAIATSALALFAAVAQACGSGREGYADGTLRAEGRRNGSGAEDGPWTYWYPNGERAEDGTFADGRRIGIWTEWYPNGQRRARGERRFDPASRSSPREGPWVSWFSNGEREASGIYRRGKREGHWDYAHDDGGLDGDRTGEYHDDERID